MILILTICLLIAFIIYWYIFYNNEIAHIKMFKGPTPLPILGNALHFSSPDKNLASFLKLREDYGGVYKVSLGFDPVYLIVSDHNFLEYIMGSTSVSEKSLEYVYLHKWLGTGLLTSSGDKWKKFRKIITPAFHFKVLEQFTDVFDDHNDVLINLLKKGKNKSCVDIYPYITLCSLDIICATLMGHDVQAQGNSKSKYVASVKEICRIMLGRALHPFKSNDKLYAISRDYQKEQEALKVLHGHTYSVLNSRKEELADINFSEEVYDTSLQNKKTLLDTLVYYKNKTGSISDEEIREQIDTFMFEGHDTTSSAISFTLYCLSMYPDIQEKVMEELQSIFQNNQNAITTYANLQEMKYLDKVIKEVLRLYPSVPIIGRQVTEDIKFGPTVLPKGQNMSIDIYSMHRDREIFPNPEKFDPERFNNDKVVKRHPYAYIPFSAGSRNCIGQKYAMMEVKATVSKILRHFELVPSFPKIEPILIAEVILKSKNGIHIGLKERF